MTTELYEAWSLEEGDQIICKDEVYRIIDLSCNFSEADEYIFIVVDEEGYRHEVVANGSQKFRVICDADTNEYA